MERVAYAVYDSPLGEIFAARSRAGVSDIAISSTEAEFAHRVMERHGVEPVRRPAGLAGLFGELDRYFDGEPRAFDTLLDIRGTPFEERVWRELLKIPWGATVTYKEMAARAGSPGGARAAGGACGRNHLPIVVPCHRVLSTGGGLGGYTGGLSIKKALLRVEGVLL